jgi:predicted kinase
VSALDRPAAIPAVIMTCGLPASGKTTTAMRLHAQLGGVLIRSCDIYQELGISLPEWVRRTRGFTVSVAEYDRVRDEAYREMARRLGASLAAGERLVILDAVHGEPSKRHAVYEICRAHKATATILLCECDSFAEVRRRFALRRGRESEPEHEAGDLSVYHDIKQRWQDPREDQATRERSVVVLTYDTLTGRLETAAADPGATVARIRATLLAS